MFNKVSETVVGILVLLMAIWPSLLGRQASTWIIILAAIYLIVISFRKSDSVSAVKASSRKRRR